jgi:3-dehydroquinate synthase
LPVLSDPSLVDRHELTIHSSFGDYQVLVGRGVLEDAVGVGSDALVVDRAVADRLSVPDSARLVLIDATEDTKTLTGCEQVVLALRELGVRRGHHVVVVGGGVVQDVGTFVTDIYMRGLPWTYVPTTLMAMTDSCIGGKSSINAGGVKNLVGGFHPPSRVIVDPVFLSTLAPSAISAGLAEAAKICYCRGQKSFDGYLERYAAFESRPDLLLAHVLDAKKWFIEVDEHDQKERLLLNFGHTFGHALEAGTAYQLSHGLGVAVGVLCALRHPSAVQNRGSAALDQHCRELLAVDPDVATLLSDLDLTAFERAFRSDKKHGSDVFRLIVPAPGEGVCRVETPSDDSGWRDICTATREALTSLGAHL